MEMPHSYARYIRQGRIRDVLGNSFELADSILGFLVSTSLFLAVSGVFKLYLAFLLYGTRPQWNLLAATFFLIFSVYGLNKLTDLDEDEINNPERTGYIKRVSGVFRHAVLVSFAVAVILGVLTSPWAAPVIIFPIFSGVLYSVSLIPGYPRLKDITGIKNVIIALTWANGTAFLPYLAAGAPELQRALMIYYFFFMKSMINTILFDVRDIEGDRANGIKTIPVKLGLRRSRNILIALNSTLVLWMLLAYSRGYFAGYMPVLVFSILNGYAYILYFARKRERPGKLLDVWVDGEWFYTLPLALFL
ncbi:prenyltransferase [Thermococcus sp. M36]|uniref:UbiA family prenyltransferase n=1 Tax=Thermococcus sp. M36 TaxID=1638261 RepID=UPI001439036F|nr:UbiA family prenyltransferase [Thermococcus sp. M36]NJE06164.1 prenyltransferase [Thermococcus sp. M36]